MLWDAWKPLKEQVGVRVGDSVLMGGGGDLDKEWAGAL